MEAAVKFVLFCCLASFSSCMMLGGWKESDPKSDKIIEVAEKALVELEKQSNALYKQKFMEVVEAHEKVVSGIMYNITMRTAYTNCRKDKNTDFSECEPDNQRTQICVCLIWEQKWLNKLKVDQFQCTNENTVQRKREIASKFGGDDHDYIGKEFKKFMNKYNKNYETEDVLLRRLNVFRDNLKRIKELQKTEQGTGEYGITKFADLTKTEFQKQYLGLVPSLAKTEPRKQAKIPDVVLPPAFDWRNHSIVTPVKNQGQCGSCWAFSVTGNVEGQWALKKGNLISLSEQELVDCDTLDEGCNGGFMTNAYEEIIKIGGLESETDYPYEGETEKCHFQKADIKVTINDYVNISKDETEMAQWLYKNGPISIGINANAMQFYYGGISHPWKFLCNPDNLDHGVLLVGFGESHYPLFNRTIPYWVVKNSWGGSWGEQGYYRVFRGDGTCGLNLMATSSIVD